MSGGHRIAVNTAEEIPGADLARLQPILKRAVGAALKHESIADASISVTLLNDARRPNEQYLGIRVRRTSSRFHSSSRVSRLSGTFIGFDQARRQAAELSVGLEAEPARLAIHGTLHVLGYDHPEDGAREGSEMWQVQESILRQVLGKPETQVVSPGAAAPSHSRSHRHYARDGDRLRVVVDLPNGGQPARTPCTRTLVAPRFRALGSSHLSRCCCCS